MRKMKRIFCLGGLIWMLALACWGETMYVSDNLDIDVRTGGGTQYRIVALIKPWDRVEVMEHSESGWSHVRLSNGKDGWMLTRFLTKERPPRPELANLQKKYQEILKNYEGIENENKELKRINQELTADLDAKEQSLGVTRSSFEKLKKDSSEFLEVKNRLDQSNKELAELRDKYGRLEETASKIRNNQIIKGLVIGGGILLSGFLMGLFSKRKQRRSSLL
jgi:SH3 domain protein